MTMPIEVLDALKVEFERCAPFLQRAIDRANGEFDLDHVRDEVISGEAQLHSRPNSAAVTRIETTASGKKFVLCWLAGGNMQEVQELENSIEKWGRSIGCTQIKIIGRKGFIRSLPGYHEQATILAKEL